MKDGIYYVYELINPLTDEVFYVGKGSGMRYADHVGEAKRGVKSYKCNVIRKILAQGLELKHRIVKTFNNEDVAYAFEIVHIQKLGQENLTNVSAGGRGMDVFTANAELKDAEKAFRKFAKSTKYFTQPTRFYLFGKWRPLDMGKVIEFKKVFTGLAIKYGTFDDWFLNSKVEALDGCRG